MSDFTDVFYENFRVDMVRLVHLVRYRGNEEWKEEIGSMTVNAPLLKK